MNVPKVLLTHFYISILIQMSLTLEQNMMFLAADQIEKLLVQFVVGFYTSWKSC